MVNLLLGLPHYLVISRLKTYDYFFWRSSCTDLLVCTATHDELPPLDENYIGFSIFFVYVGRNPHEHWIWVYESRLHTQNHGQPDPWRRESHSLWQLPLPRLWWFLGWSFGWAFNLYFFVPVFSAFFSTGTDDLIDTRQQVCRFLFGKTTSVPFLNSSFWPQIFCQKYMVCRTIN